MVTTLAAHPVNLDMPQEHSNGFARRISLSVAASRAGAERSGWYARIVASITSIYRSLLGCRSLKLCDTSHLVFILGADVSGRNFQERFTAHWEVGKSPTPVARFHRILFQLENYRE